MPHGARRAVAGVEVRGSSIFDFRLPTSGIGRSGRARRAPAGPPPLEPPPVTRQASASAPRLGPHQQKLTLYASGALVVLIVLVLLLLSPRRSPLELVPKGQTLVQVVDVRRLLDSPVYQILVTENHPLLEAFESREEELGISLRRDVTTMVETNDSRILVGRFRPGLLRECFQEKIKSREKEINRGRQTPVRLEIKKSAVDGYEYEYCDQEGVDEALAAVGMRTACFGDRWGVRRFLRARAGLRGEALDDAHFAAAYAPALARRAFLYRLERPGEKIAASTLRDVLDTAGEGVYGAFFAVATSRGSIELTVRLAARDAAAAAKLETQLSKASSGVALRQLLGADACVTVTRTNSVVVLESAIPLDGFDEIVERDKKGRGSNLILTLLAS